MECFCKAFDPIQCCLLQFYFSSKTQFRSQISKVAWLCGKMTSFLDALQTQRPRTPHVIINDYAKCNRTTLPLPGGRSFFRHAIKIISNSHIYIRDTAFSFEGNCMTWHLTTQQKKIKSMRNTVKIHHCRYFPSLNL